MAARPRDDPHGDGRVFGGAPRHTNRALVILDVLAAVVCADVLDAAEAGFATSCRRHISRAAAACVADVAAGVLDAVYLRPARVPPPFAEAPYA